MAGRYKAYPAYKDSGIEWLGEIPEGWNILRGKYIFSEINQRSSTGSEVLLSVSEYFGVKPRSESFLDDEFISRAESLEGYKKCSVNDLVINIMLAWKCGLGVSKYDGIVSPAYSVFRFFESIYPDYMHYLYRTEIYNLYFKSRSTGIIDSRLRLYPESFLDIKTLIPSKSEQQTIAQFLDYETAKIDALIAKQEQLIELLKEKRQAVISHAVTKGLNPDAPMKDSGVEWLGQVPEHWEIVPFRRFTTLSQGLQIAQDERFYEYAEELEEYITIKSINSGEKSPKEFVLNNNPRVKCYKDDILLARTGATGSAVTNIEGVFHNNFFKVSYDNNYILKDFLFVLLGVKELKAHFLMLAGTTTIPDLNHGDFLATRIGLPSKIEQENILRLVSDKVADIDKANLNVLKMIRLFKERKTALISAAVTGKIDVRDWQPPSVG